MKDLLPIDSTLEPRRQGKKLYWPIMKARAEEVPIPDKFQVEFAPDHPIVFIADSTTGRRVRIPIGAYRDVRRTLHALFR